MGVRASSPYKKSARIVGEVLGKYHPHGDAAVYDSMARLAQDFSMRYLLVDGQGNFGSIDGDAPAAMRYTEARLARMAEELLADIDKQTVNFVDNFDGSLQEPEVLPARLPNLLLNGSSGIAVGMATNIPPHNLREVVAALTYVIENYDRLDEIEVEELVKLLPGPDFPTGGLIVGKEGILQAYGTGRGRIVLRGVAHIEEMGRDRNRIVITEIPYQLNKSGLIERIAELAREGKLEDISDLRDESDRRGMSIVIELKRGAQPKKVLNKLYKYTPLQSTYGVQLLALVEGEPRLLSLKRILQIYIEHRREVITRRSQFELDKARDRAHILEGLLIALANLDDVIQTIRESKDADEARDRLMKRFKLSERQAQAILDMQLRRLAALERQKIEDEQKQTLERIAYLEDLLANPKKILGLINEDLADIAEKYGDERRTHIALDVSEDFSVEDLVHDEAVLISITQRGYIKRVPTKTFRAQARGGRGVTGHAMKDEDAALMLFPGRTLDTVLFFSDKGKVYSEKVYQIPDADRTGRGIPIVNVLSLGANEKITEAVVVPQFDENMYCTMATLNGKIKRISLSELASVRPSGLLAITLENGDELGWVRLTNGESEIILVTEKGQALRFDENVVRTMGRQAAGVAGIRLGKGDHVAGMEVVEPGGDLAIITTLGYGKRVSLDEYPVKGRATGGVVTISQKSLDKTGPITSVRVVQDADDITIITKNGVVLRSKVKDIKQYSRASRGERLIALQKGDEVATFARLAEAELRNIEASVSESPEPVSLLGSNGSGPKSDGTSSGSDGAQES
jgi:DNA gyrase subunit A